MQIFASLLSRSRPTSRPFSRCFSPLSVTLASLSFHFIKLELLMYQATRIDGVRSHFVVNTASAVVSMRTAGTASRFNNRTGTLSQVPHSKTSYVHAHAIRNNSTLTSDVLRARTKTSITDDGRRVASQENSRD